MFGFHIRKIEFGYRKLLAERKEELEEVKEITIVLREGNLEMGKDNAGRIDFAYCYCIENRGERKKVHVF